MIQVVSVENMRLSDAYTIDNLVSGQVLMYRAAMGIFKSVHWSGHIAIVVGSGNNGGDGFALACILKEHGFHCTVFYLSQNLSPDSAHYALQCKEAGVCICPFESNCLNDSSIIVDCLLGTGFSGPLRGNYRNAIESINKSNAFIISVDINSGMNGDTGEAEIAVESDLTVTIGYIKSGLVTQNAGQYIERLVCTDIGIVLLREEGFLSDETCPPWLDKNVIISL